MDSEEAGRACSDHALPEAIAQDMPFGMVMSTVQVPSADVKISSTRPSCIKPKAIGTS